MELASGFSSGFDYGNGYTPLANNAINNNNFNYNANQNYANQVGQYNPFTQSGGFGAQTDYYSGLGAAYGRATGGFGAQPQQQQAPQEDLVARYWELMGGGGGGYSGGGIGSDAARAPGQITNQPYQPDFNAKWDDSGGQFSGARPAQGNTGRAAVDWNQYFNDVTANSGGGFSGGGIGSDAARAANQGGFTPQQMYTGGYNPYDPGTYAGSAQGNIGGRQPAASYTPAYGAGGQLDPSDAGNIARYWELMGGGGGSSSRAPDPTPQTPQQMYGNGGYNPYDPATYAGSAQGNIGGQQPQANAMRDQLAQQMSQQPQQSQQQGTGASEYYNLLMQGGFGMPGSTQGGGYYGGRGVGSVGQANDAYGNPYFSGNAPAYYNDNGMGIGGLGMGGMNPTDRFTYQPWNNAS